jgi:acetolactate synthase I/II/III large subunit
VIHVDVDPAEIGKNRSVDVPIVGDVKVVLGQLLKVLEDKRAKGSLDELVPDVTAWRATSTS